MKKLLFLFVGTILLVSMAACGSSGDNDADSTVTAESFQQEVAKSLVLGVAKGVGSEVGGDATGWVLGKVFGGGDDPGTPDPATVQAIQDVGDKIATLSGQIEDFKKDVDDALNKLYIQGVKTQYTSQVASLEAIIANARTIRNDFLSLTTRISPDTGDWQTLASQLDTELDIHELETQLATVQQVMVSGDPDGALELWGDLTVENLKKNGSNAEACFLSVMNQFQRFYLVQADLLNFIVEKAHRIYNDPSSKAVPALESYRAEMLQQAEVFLTYAERVLAYYFNPWPDGIQYQTDNDYPFHEDWHLDGLDLVRHNNYQSSHMAMADEIVAQAMGWENSLTIRIAEIYAGEEHAILPEISAVLVNETTGQEFTAETHAAQISRNIYSDQTNVFDYPYRWDVKRFVFNDLPDGRYHLKDIYAEYTTHFEGRDIKLLNQEYLSHIFIIEEGMVKNMMCRTYAEVR